MSKVIVISKDKKETARQMLINSLEVVLYCPGSLTAPDVHGGKPHCTVCGEAFKWQQMVDCIQHVPEH